jgi:hypothetical protein
VKVLVGRELLEGEMSRLLAGFSRGVEHAREVERAGMPEPSCNCLNSVGETPPHFRRILGFETDVNPASGVGTGATEVGNFGAVHARLHGAARDAKNPSVVWRTPRE